MLPCCPTLSYNFPGDISGGLRSPCLPTLNFFYKMAKCEPKQKKIFTNIWMDTYPQLCPKWLCNTTFSSICHSGPHIRQMWQNGARSKCPLQLPLPNSQPDDQNRHEVWGHNCQKRKKKMFKNSKKGREKGSTGCQICHKKTYAPFLEPWKRSISFGSFPFPAAINWRLFHILKKKFFKKKSYLRFEFIKKKMNKIP